MFDLLGLLYCLLKLLVQLPSLYESYQLHRKDSRYKKRVEAIDAAYGAFVFAAHEKNIKAQLDALERLK